MMTRMIALAAFAAIAFAQAPTAKVAPPPTHGMAAPTERALTEVEQLKLQLAIEKIQRLQDKYKLAAYQEEVKPIIADQEAVVSAACASIGIAKEELATKCGLSLASKDAAGKDVAARVWVVAKPANQ